MKRIDIVTGEPLPYTDEEVHDIVWVRRMRFAWAGFTVGVLFTAVGVFAAVWTVTR